MKGRTGWSLLALASAAGLVVSLYGLTQRTVEFNKEADALQLRIEVLKDREFTIFNGRKVKITDEEPGPGDVAPGVGLSAGEDVGAAPGAILRVEYGDVVERIPVVRPPVMNLPDLGGFSEWAVLLKVADLTDAETNPPTGPDPERGRLVMVTRNPPVGYEPGSWGSVRRIEWTFSFYQFKPDGTVERGLYRFPRSNRTEKRLMTPDPETGQLDPLAKVEPLKERTWQYSSALFAMPTLQVPRHKFKDDAVSVMGWTLPGAMFSGLVFAVSLSFAIGPSLRRRFPPATGSGAPSPA